MKSLASDAVDTETASSEGPGLGAGANVGGMTGSARPLEPVSGAGLGSTGGMGAAAVLSPFEVGLDGPGLGLGPMSDLEGGTMVLTRGGGGADEADQPETEADRLKRVAQERKTAARRRR